MLLGCWMANTKDAFNMAASMSRQVMVKVYLYNKVCTMHHTPIDIDVHRFS